MNRGEHLKILRLLCFILTYSNFPVILLQFQPSIFIFLLEFSLRLWSWIVPFSPGVFMARSVCLRPFAGYFGAGSGFRVGWRTAGGGGGGGVSFCFSLVLTKFLFCWGGTGHWAVILWSSNTLVKFPMILVLSCSATREETRIPCL